MKKIMIYAAMLLVAVSCIYSYDPKLDPSDEDIIVVEGNIILGGVSTARLSKVYPFSGGSVYYRGAGLTGGTVVVEDDSGKTYLPSGPSVSYFNIPTQDAEPGRKYRLKASLDGREYASDWIEPLAPPQITDVTFSADGRDVYVNISAEGGEDATGYIGVTFDETWEFHADFVCEYVLNTNSWSIVNREDYEGEPYYWCWRSSATDRFSLVNFTEMEGNKVVSYPFYSFTRTDSRNHRKYSINVKARTLSKETYRYLKNLDDISTSGRSLFTPNPGEVASNVRCESDPDQRVLGYVTAAQLSTFRAFMDDRYLRTVEPSTSALVIPDSPTEFPNYYSQGFYPVTYATVVQTNEEGEDVEVTGLAWGRKRCFDCVAAGGTREKPDYWQ